MTFRLVDKGWGQVMREAAAADAGALRSRTSRTSVPPISTPCGVVPARI